MSKAERGFGEGRIVAALLVGSLAIALAGCGGADGSGAAGTAGTSSTGATAVADTAAPGAGGSSATGSATGGSGSTSIGSSGGGTNAGGGSTGGSSGGSTSQPPVPPAASTSSVTLGWQPPTENTNGSPITDLAGYKIHYGTASANYTQVVSVNNAGLTRYVVDNLPKGTYYFAITAYDSKGLESALSGEVSSAVN